MPGIRGISVSVGPWYAETSRVTLPLNMRHEVEHLVVTAPGDPVIPIARAVPGVRVFETDAFTRHRPAGYDGPLFNKGLALNEGVEAMGRHGWVAITDADIVWPDIMPLDRLRVGFLHGARRRVLDDPAAWRPDLDWRTCKRTPGEAPIGYLQIFHADDPALAGKPCWYDPTFAHAGGGDAFFMTHWGRGLFRMLPAEVLHLGPVDTHWFGTDDAAKDLMAKFVTRNDWQIAAAKFTPEQVARAGELVERVAVPGYVSDYELPFVRRAQKAGVRP